MKRSSLVFGMAVAAGGMALLLTPKSKALAQIAPCTGTPESYLVDVTQAVSNDPDSGNFGSWATDAFTKHIRIWSDGEGYCASTEDSGTFVTTGPQTPNSGDPLDAGINGTFSGGAKYVINGSFKSEPNWPTTGAVPANTCEDGCPSGTYSKFIQEYFDESEYDYLDWGWVYASCGHGTWTNSQSGNSGDIVNGPTDEICVRPTPEPTATPVPRAGQQSKTAISDPVCKDSNFDARIQLSLDSKQVKDVQVKFVYNNEAKYAKTGEDGWAGVAFGYRGDSNVEFYPEQGYPTQLQKVTSSSSCKTPVVLGASTTSGKVLGATTLAKTGGEEMLVNLAGMVGAGLTTAGISLKLKKKN